MDTNETDTQECQRETEAPVDHTSEKLDEHRPTALTENQSNISIGEHSSVDKQALHQGEGNVTQAGRDVNCSQDTNYLILDSDKGDLSKLFKNLFKSPCENLANPFRPLPPAPSPAPVLAREDLEYRHLQLLDDHLLLIECLDQDVAVAAAYSLVEKLGITGADKCLGFYPDHIDSEGLCRLDIKLFSDNPYRLPAGSVVVVDLTSIDSEGSTHFLDSIRRQSLSWSSQIKHELNKGNLYVICLIGADTLSGEKKPSPPSDYFRAWKLDYLQPLLKHLSDGNNIQNLHSKLRDIRTRGAWGPESEFLINLRRLLQAAPDKLEHQINTTSELNAASDTGRDCLQTLLQYCNGETPLHRLALYIATFFPRLSPPDFSLVFQRLAGEETMEISRSVEKTDENGEKIAMVEIDHHRLADQWNQGARADLVFRDCLLQAVAHQESREWVIDFQAPWIRSRLQEYMECHTPNYLTRMFDRIRVTGLLFDSPPPVVDGIIKRIKEMALSYPDHHGNNWLQEMTGNILCTLSANLNSDLSPWENFVQQWKNDRLSRSQMHRFSYLIRAMLDDSQLRHLVDAFFNRLLAHGLHKALLDIVRPLRSAPGFDAVHWFRQLLERGSAELEAGVYQALLQHLIWDETRLYRLLGEIWSWIPPEMSAPPDHPPPESTLVARRLTVEISGEFTRCFPHQNYGDYANKFPFLTDEHGQADTRGMERLIDILLAPELPNQCIRAVRQYLLLLIAKWTLNDEPAQLESFMRRPIGLIPVQSPRPGKKPFSEEQQTVLYFISALVAEWHMMLTGADNTADNRASVYLNALLNPILRRPGRELRFGMPRCWEFLKSQLLLNSDLVSRRDPASRLTLKHRRKNIQKLIVSFKQMSKTTTDSSI